MKKQTKEPIQDITEKKVLQMSIKHLLPDDIVYIYGHLKSYDNSIERALTKHRKKENYEKDPQFIYEMYELKRLRNVVQKLFSLHRRLSADEAQTELEKNAGVDQQQ